MYLFSRSFIEYDFEKIWVFFLISQIYTIILLKVWICYIYHYACSIVETFLQDFIENLRNISSLFIVEGGYMIILSEYLIVCAKTLFVCVASLHKMKRHDADEKRKILTVPLSTRCHTIQSRTHVRVKIKLIPSWNTYRRSLFVEKKSHVKKGPRWTMWWLRKHKTTWNILWAICLEDIRKMHFLKYHFWFFLVERIQK